MSDVKVKDFLHPAPGEHISDQRRAFLEYKRRVAASGKPFFPNGTYHDVIAGLLVVLCLIGLSFVWFAQANCDNYVNPFCSRVSTPLEQKQFTPKHPGQLKTDAKGAADTDVKKPLLGALYEEKADPATTSYHPRPEWYFYFLFYLLIVFSNPNLVVLGTIIVPTIWLVMLLAWPFIDRRAERRPSRRPVAMAAMVLVAATLLAFTYKGSQQGKEKGGPTGLTAAQTAMPGYKVLFEDPGVFETCASCHVLGGVGGGHVGPDLTQVGTRYKTADDMFTFFHNGKGGMPPKGGTALTDEQSAQVAAFLKTLGDPGSAASLQSYGANDAKRLLETKGS